MSYISIVVQVLILATIVEALLEYVFGIWWQPFPDTLRPKILMAFGLGLGIAVAIFYEVDILADLGFPPSLIGQIITGAIIGRGSEYTHQLYNLLKSFGPIILPPVAPPDDPANNEPHS